MPGPPTSISSGGGATRARRARCTSAATCEAGVGFTVGQARPAQPAWPAARSCAGGRRPSLASPALAWGVGWGGMALTPCVAPQCVPVAHLPCPICMPHHQPRRRKLEEGGQSLMCDAWLRFEREEGRCGRGCCVLGVQVELPWPALASFTCFAIALPQAGQRADTQLDLTVCLPPPASLQR